MKVKWGLGALILLLIACGIFALAADYGTQNDPLVSLSYINDVLKPNIIKQVDDIIKVNAHEQNTTVLSFDERMDKKLKEFFDRNTMLFDKTMMEKVAARVVEKIPAQKAIAPFATVSVPSGKTLVLSAGCELLLKSGNGSCVSSGVPGFIDMTNGGALNSGASLITNHLYLVSDSGRKVVAQKTSVLLVRGKYSLE